MKKIKILMISILILAMSIIPVATVNAAEVTYIELDPDYLITFPMIITNGNGKLTIDEKTTDYKLYYQAVEIINDNYIQLEQMEENGQKTLDNIKVEIDKLKAEYDKSNTIFKEAQDNYNAKVEAGALETEIEEARLAYEEAKQNVKDNVNKYNAKVNEYNAKVEEILNEMEKLIPNFNENNWTETKDGSFSIDISQFSGNKAFTIWVKLVTSDGTIIYDRKIYSISGAKVEDIIVEEITLDKTELTLEEGSSYTLIPTIIPSDSTDKTIIWKSENENVAKVENGKVTAISEGTTTITASTKDGKQTAMCNVTVTKKQDTSNTVPDKEQDPTIANTVIPKAGLTKCVVALAIIALAVIVIVTYKKVKYLNFK